MNNLSCNMTNTESYLRLTVSFIMMIVAVYISCYILMLLSITFAYTGIKKHCFIYDILKINEKFSLKNYYTSHLPKHNPSAVFMFNKTGEIYFQNDSALKNFTHINNIQDLDINNSDQLINKNIQDTLYYDNNNYHYQLNIKGISEIDSILIYATDISQIVDLNEEIELTQKEIIYTMGEIGETRSKETGNHVKRVAEYSKLLALLYGLDEKEAEQLKMASPMHDIGKVGIPDSVLNKPGQLDIDEWKIMQTHAQLGYDMLKSSERPIIKAAAIVAGEHHEKWDGSGYPKGLTGENIHIYGRITAVADVFDALGSQRVYKQAWELEEILNLFKEERGKHFDPKLIDLFFKNLDSFLEIRNRYKDI